MIKPVVLCLVSFASAFAEPVPGDVFREFTYGMRFGQMDLGSKRPDLEAMRARSQEDRNLELPSLKNVIKAEVSVEFWGGHVGTSEQKFRINEGSWNYIAQPEGTPGKPECYHRTVLGRSTVTVPVESLKAGRNAFQFFAGPQVCHSFDWGFYWVYAFTVRLYYDPAKVAPVGKITSPAEGDEISENPRIVAEAHMEEIPIANVEFIGKFEDFNWEGNGVYRQWHYITQRGQLARHIGSATLPPYAVTWDTSWVPDQGMPVEIAARVTDADGLIHMTKAVKVQFKRRGRSVRMYKAKDIPTAFAVRVGRRKDCKFEVDEDPSRARAARIVLSTWSAAHGDEIGFNGTKLVDRVGLVHNYSFDSIPVPLKLLRRGLNAFEMYSKTEHHALEVNWPGPVLLVEYGTETPKVEAQGQLSVEEVDYEGQSSFRVRTRTATYTYHKEGAGFASITDPSGAEWIGYKPGGRAAGEFRGIPNLGAFAHPGYTGTAGATSRVIAKGSVSVSILSEGRDGKWATRWDFFQTHARMTLLRTDKLYWFLYEGTPGGRLDLKNGFQITSDGLKRTLAESWSGDMRGPEWIYFGNEDSKSVLFIAKQEDDDVPDQYWPMDGSMTVFGFGRMFTCCKTYLTTAPARFTIGLTANASFDRVSRVIASALETP